MESLKKENTMQRLTGNLQVDMTETQRQLSWQPVINVEEGLRRAVEGVA